MKIKDKKKLIKKANSLLSWVLTERQIFSKVYFTPIHNTSFYSQKFGNNGNSLPITEKISEQVLTLPLYPNMTVEEKDLLVETIYEFFETEIHQ